MTENKNTNNNNSGEGATPSANSLTVYRKKSTYQGAGENDYWYSATRSDGCSVTCKFKCQVPDEIGSAFIITNIRGSMKMKEVRVKGETYINYTYYITECKFSEIPSVDLPF